MEISLFVKGTLSLDSTGCYDLPAHLFKSPTPKTQPETEAERSRDSRARAKE
jgi:hypothetical protein